jgi:hypothetical protein
MLTCPFIAVSLGIVSSIVDVPLSGLRALWEVLRTCHALQFQFSLHI